MKTTEFPKERLSCRQIFPFPEEGRTVEENPPCFAWIPVTGTQEPVRYTLTVRDEAGEELYRGETERNYLVPDCFFPAGHYTWNVLADGAERGESTFSVAENAVRIPRISAEELYRRIPTGHPRHLFSDGDRETLCRERSAELKTLRRNAEQAYRDGIPEPPRYHRDPGALPYREYFGAFRDFCDRNLIALSLLFSLTEDKTAGAFAKELLLTFCDWSPLGPASLLGPWGDEVGLSMARCLPSAFDLLYPILSPEERTLVARTVRAYGAQCLERLQTLNYCLNPGDSHAGRVPAYLGEAAMVLKDSGVQTPEEGIAWLREALEIYGGIFPYYGTPDGGWAEGTFYATSYTKWYLPFFSAVERYGGTRFSERPFYRRLTRFLVHFADPNREVHPFGDGYWCHPDDREFPGFFAQNPFRYYADRFGPAEAERMEKAQAAPELFRLHLLDVFLPTPHREAAENGNEIHAAECFPDAGFVALHSDLAHPERDAVVLARASRFGSDSHRHPDQGSFALFFRGIGLIIPSGYFGRRYGSRHHREWLNSTRAHNAILVNGVGQARDSMGSRGRIRSVTDDGTKREAVLELGEAYPMLNHWTRTLTLCGNTLTVTDEIEAPEAVEITYPLHMLSCPKQSGDAVTVERDGVLLRIVPEEPFAETEISDHFAVELNAGEPEAYHVTMPPQYHLFWKTEKKKKHRIFVRFFLSETTPRPKTNPTST